MNEDLESLDQTIFLLEKVGSDEGEIRLAKLYKELKGIRSHRRFQRKICQITDILQGSSCNTNVCYSHWVVICGLLFACFLKHLDDSDTVARILKCMENHFTSDKYFVFQDSILKLKLSPQIIKDRNKSGLKSYSFLAYYFHHANESRLTIHGERFIALTGIIGQCNPMIVIPGSVITCLQYGGRLADKKRISRSYIPNVIKNALYEIIKYGLQNNLWDRTLSFHLKPSATIFSYKRLKNMCCYIKAVLQDTMNPHEVTFLLAGQVVGDFQVPHLEVLVPFYDRLFPDCLYGRRTPPLLRHTCRHFIRKALFDNWKLPDGIDSLPIPEIVRDYLNLLYD